MSLVSSDSIPFIPPEKINEMSVDQLTKIIVRHQKHKQRVINESVVVGIVKTSGFVGKMFLGFNEEVVDQATDSILRNNYTMKSATEFLENAVLPNLKLIAVGVVGVVVSKIAWDSWLSSKSETRKEDNDKQNETVF